MKPGIPYTLFRSSRSMTTCNANDRGNGHATHPRQHDAGEGMRRGRDIGWIWNPQGESSMDAPG